jgi:hypothetical protein
MLEVLEKFPEVDIVNVKVNAQGSDLGTVTTIKFDTDVNSVEGSFEVEIGRENRWDPHN